MIIFFFTFFVGRDLCEQFFISLKKLISYRLHETPTYDNAKARSTSCNLSKTKLTRVKYAKVFQKNEAEGNNGRKPRPDQEF